MPIKVPLVVSFTSQSIYSRNRKPDITQLCVTPVVILTDSFHQVLHNRIFRIVVSPFFASYLGCHCISLLDSRNRNLTLDSIVSLQLLLRTNLIDSVHQVLHIRMFHIVVSPVIASYLGYHSVSSLAIDFRCGQNGMPSQNLRSGCKEVRSYLHTVTWRHVGYIVVQQCCAYLQPKSSLQPKLLYKKVALSYVWTTTGFVQHH